MILIKCDNCPAKLKDVADLDNSPSGSVTEGNEYERRVTLRMSLNTTGDLMDMDLCPRCAKRIIKALEIA